MTFDEMIETYAALKSIEARLIADTKEPGFMGGHLKIDVNSESARLAYVYTAEKSNWHGTTNWHASSLPQLIRRIAGMEK